MKAKIVKELLNPKTGDVLLTVGQVVEFAIVDGKEGKKTCKIDGCPLLVPVKKLAEHAQFTKDTKAELVSMGLIEATPAAQPAAEEKKPEPAAEKKEQPKAQLEAKAADATGLCAAIHQLNLICKGGLLGMHITRVDEECIEGDLTFISTKLPPVNFSIGVGDFTTGKLEREVAQFIDDHSQTITNKLEIIEQLDEQIKARQEELQKAKEEKVPAKPAAKPAAKAPAKPAAKPAAEKKEEEAGKPADLFDAAQAEEAPEEEVLDEGDFEEPQGSGNPVDDELFED